MISLIDWIYMIGLLIPTLLYQVQYSIDKTDHIDTGKAICHAIYANRQGAKKDAKCPFYHGVSGSKRKQ